MIRNLSVDSIYANPNQPRKQFDEASACIQELADSIKEHGLLQPISVRPDQDGKFMIIMGERRWRAHKLAEIKVIKAIIVEISDNDLADRAIVENLQRKALSPLEEAMAYQARLDSGYTIEQLAKRLGLRQSWRVTERTSLLKLRPDYQDLLKKSHITPSQAYEMSRLSTSGQDKLISLIKAGQCDNYNRLRSAANAILEKEQQTSFLEPPEQLTPEEQSKLDAIDRNVNQMSAILNKWVKNNEVDLIKRIDPYRANLLADQIKIIQSTLGQVEKELRKSIIQQDIAA